MTMFQKQKIQRQWVVVLVTVLMMSPAALAGAEDCTPGETFKGNDGYTYECDENGSVHRTEEDIDDETSIDDVDEDYEADDNFDAEDLVGGLGGSYSEDEESYEEGSYTANNEGNSPLVDPSAVTQKEIKISSETETESKGADEISTGGGAGGGAGSGGSAGGEMATQPVPETPHGDAAQDDKNKESEKKSKDFDPVYNNKYLIPQEMANYCEISAEDVVNDIEKLHECVRKYVSKMRNEDPAVSDQGNKDFQLLQYKLLIANIQEALKTSLAVAHYEEMQNKQSEARSEGSTQRDQEAGMSSSKAFSINVLNNFINTTADYLKYIAFSRMSSIDVAAMTEDSEKEDAGAEIASTDLEGGTGADLTEGSAHVEGSEEQIDEDAMQAGIHTSPDDTEASDICILEGDVVMRNSDSQEVGENQYVICKDGDFMLCSKKEDGTFEEGTVISHENAQTLLGSSESIVAAAEAAKEQVEGAVGQISGIVGSDNKGDKPSSGDDQDGDKPSSGDDQDGDKPSSGDDQDGDKPSSDNDQTDDNGKHDDASSSEDDQKSGEDKKEEKKIDSTKYSGVYNGRQLYPDIMAHVCKINGDDMATDITQIEDCMLVYINKLAQIDASEQAEAKKDFETLRLAMLNDLQSEAETKLDNIENIRKGLKEKYEKAAGTSPTTQRDTTVVAETEAYLTDVTNALREMYAAKMKYESISGIEGVDPEVALDAQPKGTMLQTVVVKPDNK